MHYVIFLLGINFGLFVDYQLESADDTPISSLFYRFVKATNSDITDDGEPNYDILEVTLEGKAKFLRKTTLKVKPKNKLKT